MNKVIEFYGRESMTEIMRSQGVEVAGEDYAANQKKELEDWRRKYWGNY